MTNYTFAMTLAFLHRTSLTPLLCTKSKLHDSRNTVMFVHYIIPSTWISGWQHIMLKYLYVSYYSFYFLLKYNIQQRRTHTMSIKLTKLTQSAHIYASRTQSKKQNITSISGTLWCPFLIIIPGRIIMIPDGRIIMIPDLNSRV